MYSQQELTEKVHKLRELKRQQEDLENQINAISNELKDIMSERSVDGLVGEDWKITWKMIQSSRFDQKSFKEANPSLYESFVVANNYRAFKLT